MLGLSTGADGDGRTRHARLGHDAEFEFDPGTATRKAPPVPDWVRAAVARPAQAGAPEGDPLTPLQMIG